MRFGYVILHVLNVGQAVAFYEAAFDLKTRFLHESGQYAEMETGDTALAFASDILAQASGLPARPTYLNTLPFGAEIALVTGNVEVAFERAVDAGAVGLVTPTTKPWDQVVAYVRDLNGFLVELCTPVGNG